MYPSHSSLRSLHHSLQWRFGRQYIDVTEIYRQVKPRRQQAVTKLIVYLFLFAWILYRCCRVSMWWAGAAVLLDSSDASTALTPGASACAAVFSAPPTTPSHSHAASST